MTKSKLEESLEKFLRNNQKSRLEKISIKGKTIEAVTNPWGDPALVGEISKENNAFIDALNNVILPERLSAIYHTDNHDLEIIWTAYKLSDNNKEVAGREFFFRFGKKSYKCEFKESSNRLLAIAESMNLVGPSDNGYRNLPSFRRYQEAKNEGISRQPIFGSPYSFWIRDIEYDEETIVDFLTNLNFYLAYFDELSPLILIHPPQISKNPVATQTRYRHNKFPENISSRGMDSELLQFWGASQFGDPARQFLYAFRIVEHSAFFFVESAPRLAVKKVLMMPHALDDIAEATERVIAAVKTSKIDEYTKFEHILCHAVDPYVLWQVIEPNLPVLSVPIKFDGGFELPPLVAGAASRDEFANSGVKNFCGLVRKIRNALSHGKEEKTATVITPTIANFEKLRPWAALMKRAAGEVMVYEYAR